MTGNTSPRRLAAGGLVTAFLIGGCAGPPAAGPDPIGVRPASSPIQFRDVTRELGIEFHAGVTNRTPLSIVELMGGGVGFL
ncbi:MAG: hypothetical protein FJX77_10735, partial [Armatimonadetes bacterium]|nr:hypothetical protein [Armatimonadota bacterium]